MFTLLVKQLFSNSNLISSFENISKLFFLNCHDFSLENSLPLNRYYLFRMCILPAMYRLGIRNELIQNDK